MPYGIINSDLMTTSDGVSSAGLYGFKNRLINGDMRIDQRNAGASVTNTTGFLFGVDRWKFVGSVASKFTSQQNAASVTPPVGFSNYLGITSSSAYSILTGDYFFICQNIEGFNTSDLAWGTANAATITLSFWVRSSLTGTFGGSVQNSASNRSYPFTYTINSANTWEKETITIAGDTSGTWIGATNGTGLQLAFSLGTGATASGTAGAWAGADYRSATGATSVVGTNGATFYITGVQLEKGSTATSFDYRPYGTELNLCLRYYYKHQGTTGYRFGNSYNASATQAVVWTPFIVPMRANPSALEQTGTASDYSIGYLLTSTVCNSVPTFASADSFGATYSFFVVSGLTAGQASAAISATNSGYLAWSAEL